MLWCNNQSKQQSCGYFRARSQFSVVLWRLFLGFSWNFRELSYEDSASTLLMSVPITLNPISQVLASCLMKSKSKFFPQRQQISPDTIQCTPLISRKKPFFFCQNSVTDCRAENSQIQKRWRLEWPNWKNLTVFRWSEKYRFAVDFVAPCSNTDMSTPNTAY